MAFNLKNDRMFYRFALYGFLKNLRFFEPFIILIFRENGLSFFQIGLLYSIRDLAAAVLEVPTGVFADAFGRRLAMVMAFGAYLISFVIFFLFGNFYLAAVAMVCFAFGEAFRSGTHKALILEHLNLNQMQDLKVAYYGRTRAASQLGSAANALLAAGLVLYAGNYRYMFIASTLPYALNLFNLISYPKALDGNERAPFQKGVILTQIKGTLRTFLAIFRDGNAIRALLNSAGFTAFFKTSKDYLQPILETFAVTLPFFVLLDDTRRAAILVGLTYSLIFVLSSYASRSAAKVSERFSNLALAINVTFLLGAGFQMVAGVAAWQHLPLLSIFVFLGLYLVQNLRKPMTVALISDQISSKVMATGLSVEAQLATLIMVILSPLLGLLADTFGIGAALAGFGAGMVLCSLYVSVGEKRITA